MADQIFELLHNIILFLEERIADVLDPNSPVGTRVTATLITTIVITIVIKPTSAMLREIWMAVATRHDASALAYLGTEKNVAEFANAALFPDSPRYSTVYDTVIPHNDPRDVIGFIIGRPRWLDQSKWIDQKGYYAYVLINWQMYEQLREWTRRGYGIQKVALLDEEGGIDSTRVDSRHMVVTPFNEENKYMYDICKGPSRVFRWHPYRKLGFESERLDLCTLSIQARGMAWIEFACRAVFVKSLELLRTTSLYAKLHERLENRRGERKS